MTQPASVSVPYTGEIEGARSHSGPTLPPANSRAYIDQYGIDLAPALARNLQTEEENAPLLPPQTKQKKKKDYLSHSLPRRYDTRSATEKRQREETDNVWASASAPTEEREEQAHTYNTRNQAQKRNK